MKKYAHTVSSDETPDARAARLQQESMHRLHVEKRPQRLEQLGYSKKESMHKFSIVKRPQRPKQLGCSKKESMHKVYIVKRP